MIKSLLMFSLAVLFLFGCSPPSNSSEYDLRIVGISASLGLAEAETIQQLDYEIYIKNYSSEPVEIKSMKPTMPIFLQERLVENNLKQELKFNATLERRSYTDEHRSNNCPRIN
ncbi:MAG: hypothetical protein LRY73_15565 [Bacillus sp. (in: Bacteria)]|nr:hypothetical protein [Bacillus sp. (in: firmicutes)]